MTPGLIHPDKEIIFSYLPDEKKTPFFVDGISVMG
jgi:hypothetical protein